MTKVWLIALSATLLLPTAAEAQPKDKCRYQGLDGHHDFSPTEVHKTILCAGTHFGLSDAEKREAVAIAKRESGLGRDETNDSSLACGDFQFWPASTFYTRIERVTRKMKPWVKSCYNDRAATLAAVWEMAHLGFGAWGG